MGQKLNDDSLITPRLYNLTEDIGEKSNVADQHPDIVVSLQNLAAKMIAEIGGANPSSRRKAGIAEHPKTLYPVEEKKTPQKNKK
jgi:hypothetical protein